MTRHMKNRLRYAFDIITVIPVLFACFCLPCIETNRVLYGRGPMFRKNRSSPPTTPPPQPECCVEERENWRQEARLKGLIPGPQEEMRLLGKDSSRTKGHRGRRTRDVPTGMSFDRFSELPLELRERIYELYFEAHGRQRLTPFKLPPIHGDRLEDKHYYKPIPPHEPAVTHVSRAVRKESLKVFYSTYRFPFIVHLEHFTHFTAVDWYHYLLPEHFKAIRHFELHYCFEKPAMRYSSIRSTDVLIVDIDFSQRQNVYTMDVRTPQGSCGPTASSYGRSRGYLMSTFRRALDDMIRGPGVGNFTATDLDRLAPDTAMVGM